MDDLANAGPPLGVMLVTIGGWLYARHLHRGLMKREAARRSLHPGPDQVRRRGEGDKGMNPHAYGVDIRPLAPEAGGGFLATVPELPGCKSDGETPQQALENAYDAIACWIEAAEEMGRPVPQPQRLVA
jgi:predicted RNase H-like HicB family nuclease